LDTITFYFKQN